MNKSTRKIMFATGTDDWATPDDLFAVLDKEFGFTLDAAACSTNHKVARWFGPGGRHEDALALKSWGNGEIIWLNPPYSRPLQGQFIARAREEARRGNCVVLLLPARTDTKMFHSLIWNRETHRPYEGVQVRFIKGRLRFKRGTGENIRTSMRNQKSKNPSPNDCAPFPSMLVVFEP